MYLEQAIESLKKNRFLSEPVKENMGKLIGIFTNQYPNFDLDNFVERLETLQMTRSQSQFTMRQVANYDLGRNTIAINPTELQKDENAQSKYDAEYIMMIQLLNMITAKNPRTGMQKVSAYEGFNAGFASMLATNLVGNEGEVTFCEDEVVIVNLLGRMVGIEALEKNYFENNPMYLEMAWKEQGYQEQELASLMKQMNYNLEYHSYKSNRSNLADTETLLVQQLGRKENLTIEQLEDFYTNLVINPYSYSRTPELYGDFGRTETYYRILKEELAKKTVNENVSAITR